jgi:hypothetical protein
MQDSSTRIHDNSVDDATHKGTVIGCIRVDKHQALSHTKI